MPSTGLTVSNVFGNESGNQPATQIDTNFAQLFAAYNALTSVANYFVDGGAVNAIAVTVPTPLVVALVAGTALQVKVANSNTGATTINVNGLGANNVVYPGTAAALSSGQLVAGGIYSFMFDGTNWQYLGSQASGGGTQLVTGSTTITLSGMSSTTQGTLNYAVIGGAHVTLEVNSATAANITGTSSTNQLQMSQLPAVCYSTSFQRGIPCIVVDNSLYKYATANIQTNGFIYFALAGVNGSFLQDQVYNTFAIGGSKGLPYFWTITYSIV